MLSFVTVRKYYFQPTENSAYKIAPEARLRIDGVNWTDSERTVLVALAKDCKYCSASAKFYRRLVAGLNNTDTRLIAVFAENDSDAEAYLKGLNVPIRELRRVSFSSLGITNVPTVAILDRNRVVTDMWVGKLSPLKEAALMAKLNLENASPSDEWSIDEASLARKLADKERLVLHDIRDRISYAAHHRDGARNIPLDELPVRAQNELPLDHTIVIYSNDSSHADLAYSIVDSQGFANVLILVQETKSSEN